MPIEPTRATEHRPRSSFGAVGIAGVSAVFVGLQAWAVVGAHFRSDKRFGFWMFAESSRYRAQLVRELDDGREVRARRGVWLVASPGEGPPGYAWDAMVRDFRLDDLESWKRAKTGMAITLEYLDRALDWVLERIPSDRETVRLHLDVQYSRSGGPIESVRLSSSRRSLAAAPP